MTALSPLEARLLEALHKITQLQGHLDDSAARVRQAKDIAYAAIDDAKLIDAAREFSDFYGNPEAVRESLRQS